MRRLTEDYGAAADSTGRLIDPYLQFGLSFEAQPIDLDDAVCLGTTAVATAVSVELPIASYLFVLRKEGHPLVRYPVEGYHLTGSPNNKRDIIDHERITLD